MHNLIYIYIYICIYVCIYIYILMNASWIPRRSCSSFRTTQSTEIFTARTQNELGRVRCPEALPLPGWMVATNWWWLQAGGAAAWLNGGFLAFAADGAWESPKSTKIAIVQWESHWFVKCPSQLVQEKKITPTRYHPMLPVITTRSPGLILKILHGNESQRFKIGNHGLLVVWVSANLKTPGQLLGGGGRK